MILCRLLFSPLNKYIPRGEFYKNIAIVDAFLNPHIDRALQLRPDELETKAKSDKDYSFLHAMVGLTRDRQVIRDQMLAILQAGRVSCRLASSVLIPRLISPILLGHDSLHPQLDLL